MNHLNYHTMKLTILLILIFISLTEQKNIADRLSAHLNGRSLTDMKDSLGQSRHKEWTIHGRKRRSIRQDKCKEVTITRCMTITKQRQLCRTYKQVNC